MSVLPENIEEFKGLIKEYAKLTGDFEKAKEMLELYKAMAQNSGSVAVDTIARWLYDDRCLYFANYTDTVTIDPFATDTVKKIAEWQLGNNAPFIWQSASFHQRRTGGVAPINTTLPNAGVLNDGAGTLIKGVEFKFKWRTTAKIDQDSVARPSSTLKGPLFNEYIPSCQQEFQVDTKVFCEITPLEPDPGGDPTVMDITLLGTMVYGDAVNLEFKREWGKRFMYDKAGRWVR